MTNKNKVSQEDIDAFLNAIKGTKPLQKEERTQPSLQKKKPSIKCYKLIEEDEPILLSEQQFLTPVLGEEKIMYKQQSISNKILRKLHEGQYNVEGILDLHGQSVEEAGKAVIKFFHECLRKQIQIALIIHGKSQHGDAPILKNKLNHWLREMDIVLAFCSAAPRHGGRGAMYVLLRK